MALQHPQLGWSNRSVGQKVEEIQKKIRIRNDFDGHLPWANERFDPSDHPHLFDEVIKGTVPPWQKLSNIPTLYAKMFRTFYWTSLQNFPPKILRTLRDNEV